MYLEKAFELELAEHAAQLAHYGVDLVPRAPEFRSNIALVHFCVEEAARRGRPAREVLAEFLAATAGSGSG